MDNGHASGRERSGGFRRADASGSVPIGHIPVARVPATHVQASAATAPPGRKAALRGRPIGEILVSRGRLSAHELDAVLEQQRHVGGRLGELLVEQGRVADEDVVRALSEQTGIPYVSAAKVAALAPPADALALLPAGQAERLGALPLALREKELVCALREPRDLAALDELKFLTGVRAVRAVFATEATIRRGQRRFYYAELDRQMGAWAGILPELPPQLTPPPIAWPPPVLAVPEALVLEEEVPAAAIAMRERVLAALLDGNDLPGDVRRRAQQLGASPAEVERAAAAAEAIALLAPAGCRPDPVALEAALGDAFAPCRDLFAAAAGAPPESPAAAALAEAVAAHVGHLHPPPLAANG